MRKINKSIRPILKVSVDLLNFVCIVLFVWLLLNKQPPPSTVVELKDAFKEYVILFVVGVGELLTAGAIIIMHEFDEISDRNITEE